MKDHIHVVQYYETDMMMVVHHSNYIRWFEEARVHVMAQGGPGYADMEAQGIICAVMTADAKYHSMTRFGESVRVICIPEKYNGVKMVFRYEVRDLETDQLRCSGSTVHSFLSRANYKLINLKKDYPEVHESLRACFGMA